MLRKHDNTLQLSEDKESCPTILEFNLLSWNIHIWTQSAAEKWWNTHINRLFFNMTNTIILVHIIKLVPESRLFNIAFYQQIDFQSTQIYWRERWSSLPLISIRSTPFFSSRQPLCPEHQREDELNQWHMTTLTL